MSANVPANLRLPGLVFRFLGCGFEFPNRNSTPCEGHDRSCSQALGRPFPVAIGRPGKEYGGIYRFFLAAPCDPDFFAYFTAKDPKAAFFEYTTIGLGGGISSTLSRRPSAEAALAKVPRV